MIILDTCTAIKCFNFSKNWNDNLYKKCSLRKIVWDKKPDLELFGLAKSTKKYSDYRERLHKSANILLFDLDKDLSSDEFIDFISHISDIKKNDCTLLLTDLNSKNQKFSLTELKENGKKRLSDIDIQLIALSLTKPNTILASDDNRILALTEKFYTGQAFCCSAKILEKTHNMTCHKELRRKLLDKNIYYLESRYKKNSLTLC